VGEIRVNKTLRSKERREVIRRLKSLARDYLTSRWIEVGGGKRNDECGVVL
jgi:hypothetical protein